MRRIIACIQVVCILFLVGCSEGREPPIALSAQPDKDLAFSFHYVSTEPSVSLLSPTPSPEPPPRVTQEANEMHFAVQYLPYPFASTAYVPEIIESVQELQAYLSSLRDESFDPLYNSPSLSWIESSIILYDDSFFCEYALIAFMAVENYGNRLAVTSVSRNVKDTLTIQMRVFRPNIAPDALSFCAVLVELKKKDLENASIELNREYADKYIPF